MRAPGAAAGRGGRFPAWRRRSGETEPPGRPALEGTGAARHDDGPMEDSATTALSERMGGRVEGTTSAGQEFRGTLLRLSRHAAVFETYDPLPLLRLSDSLTDFGIAVHDRVLYRGRA